MKLAPPDHQFALFLRLLPRPEAEAKVEGEGGAEGGAEAEDGAELEGGMAPLGSAEQVLQGNTGRGAGQPVIFSLEDTVTSGTDESGCIEYAKRLID